jgi:DNA (cytosine-5)-methyltransferase 1
MSHGSQWNPLLIDDEDIVDPLEVFDFFTVGKPNTLLHQYSRLSLIYISDDSDSDEPDVISVGEDDEPSSGNTPLQSTSMPRIPSPQKPLKNAVVQPPNVEISSYRLNKFILIGIGDTLELRGSEEHSYNTLHSGDFIRVKVIILNLETDEILLRGHRLRRCKYEGQTFNCKFPKNL